MRVTFTKTGRRRYGVFVQRDKAPDMLMSTAPGYDAFLPHDLLHFVAEAEWGLDGAVFGTLAGGRDPGSFQQPGGRSKLTRRRQQSRIGRGRGRRSEALAALLQEGWEARRSGAALPRDWGERLGAARVEPHDLQRVLESLDELAKRWHDLSVGGSLTLEWPRPERRAHRRPPRPERRVARRRVRSAS